jgi:hypothetical protein
MFVAKFSDALVSIDLHTKKDRVKKTQGNVETVVGAIINKFV